MAAVNISDIDRGRVAFMRAVKSMSGAVTAKAGVFGAKAAEQHDAKSGLSNGELATIHEFGAGVPERSFLRAWVDESKPAILGRLRLAALEVVRLKHDVYKATEQVGQWADLQMTQRIARGIAPANSPYTIARKGSATPLVDTGKLIASIDSAVERHGKGIS